MVAYLNLENFTKEITSLMPKVPPGVPRITCRYQLMKVDDQYWGKAYDQGNTRYPEGDVFADNRDSAVLTCRWKVDISYNPLDTSRRNDETQ